MWRVHRVVFTADIAKMYRQIGIHEDDQNLQRIIWRNSPSEETKHFKLKTITYGTANAPYLAIRTLVQLAMDEKDNYKIGSKIVLQDFYVDDLISGANTINEALTAQNEVCKILQAGGFPIREELLLNIPEKDREIMLPLNFDEDNTIKTLGIH